MKHSALAADVTVALDRALCARRGVGDRQRAIVCQNIGAGVRPVAVRRTRVLLDRVAVQVKYDVLSILDNQTCNALVGSTHVIVSAIEKTSFL